MKTTNKRRRPGKNRKPNKDRITTANVTKPEIEGMSTNGVSHNDPDWYIYDPTMFAGVIQAPKLEFKGRPIPRTKSEINVDVTVPIVQQDYLIPDAVAYLMSPSAGTPSNMGDIIGSPINVAARKMYAELSASNAKTSNYAPEDVAMIILSLGQVIAMIEHLKRMYGVVNYYNFYNRAVPRAICLAANFDYDSVANNLSDFRAKVNQLIARVDTIQFPANLNYFKKCHYIYENIFVDRDDVMPSFHFMSPGSTWLLNETLVDTGSVLQTVTPSGNYTTWCTLVDEMINSIMESATFNYIFADVVNLINRNVLAPETISVQMLPIDYVVTPLYSEQFNWQVMNMTIMGKPDYTSSSPVLEGLFTPLNDVYANTDKSAIMYQPSWLMPSNQAKASFSQSLPIRLDRSDISGEEFVEYIAYHNAFHFVKQGSTDYRTVDGLSDFYCESVAFTVAGRETIYTIDRNRALTAQVDTAHSVAQLVHAPYFEVLSSQSAPFSLIPISKIGTFTQMDPRTMNNLRYEVILGLMRYR